MPHPVIRATLGLALGLFLAGPASAVPLVPPTSVLGLFTADDNVQQFDFSIAVDSIVTLETVSYAGGTLAANPAIIVPSGGFDPILTLFDSTGTFVAENDDGFASFDSFMQPSLVAGIYTVVITQFNNFFDGGVGDNIANGFILEGDPTFTSVFGCASGQFCDVFGSQRTNFFAINISAAQVVPEPSALALLGLGLVGAGLAYRRRRPA